MKKTIFVVFTATILFTACKTAIKESTVSGVWKAKEFESTIPGIPQDIQDAGKTEFLSSVYTLNADNSLEVKSNYFKEGAKGHWELDAEKKAIDMYYEMDTIKGVEKYIIMDLNKTTMVLRQEMTEIDAYVQITLEK